MRKYLVTYFSLGKIDYLKKHFPLKKTSVLRKKIMKIEKNSVSTFGIQMMTITRVIYPNSTAKNIMTWWVISKCMYARVHMWYKYASVKKKKIINDKSCSFQTNTKDSLYNLMPFLHQRSIQQHVHIYILQSSAHYNKHVWICKKV